MKKTMFLMPVLLAVMAGSPAFSQTYKTMADTAALNKEYTAVSKNVTDLTAKLNKAQSDLPGYQKKADATTADAQSSAVETSSKASNATNGDVQDARKAKKAARRSVRDAKDARKAAQNLDDQNKKIARLSAELDKKQQRLKELDAMRASINE
jgi:chromosome segregation ATPase